MAEQIEVLLGVEILGNTRNIESRFPLRIRCGLRQIIDCGYLVVISYSLLTSVVGMCQQKEKNNADNCCDEYQLSH